MGGKDSFIRTNLLFDGVIFISGVLYLLVLLFLQLIQPMLKQVILLLVLLGFLVNFVYLGFLLFKQVLGTVL